MDASLNKRIYIYTHSCSQLFDSRGGGWSSSDSCGVSRSTAVVEVGRRRIVVEYSRSTVVVGKKLWL